MKTPGGFLTRRAHTRAGARSRTAAATLLTFPPGSCGRYGAPEPLEAVRGAEQETPRCSDQGRRCWTELQRGGTVIDVYALAVSWSRFAPFSELFFCFVLGLV